MRAKGRNVDRLSRSEEGFPPAASSASEGPRERRHSQDIATIWSDEEKEKKARRGRSDLSLPRVLILLLLLLILCVLGFFWITSANLTQGTEELPHGFLQESIQSKDQNEKAPLVLSAADEPEAAAPPAVMLAPPRPLGPNAAPLIAEMTAANNKEHLGWTVVDSVATLTDLWGQKDFQCVAWCQTALCEAEGRVEPQNSRLCGSKVDATASGYCVYRNTTSGAMFKLFPKDCTNSYGSFTCNTLLDAVGPHLGFLETLEEMREALMDPQANCTGWRQTEGCNPYGKREPQNDASCFKLVDGSVSGYCEFSNGKRTYKVGGKDCSRDVMGSHFRCSNIMETLSHGTEYTKEIKDGESLAELRARHGRGELICLGFRGLDAKGRPDAALDSTCDGVPFAASAGYCSFVDKTYRFYQLYLGMQRVMDGLITCQEALIQPETPPQTEVVVLKSKEDYEAASKTPNFRCVAFRFVHRRGYLRMPTEDGSCASRVALPGHGYCEYRAAANGTVFRYQLWLNGTSWRNEAHCDNPLHFYWQKFTMLDTFHQVVDLFQKIPRLTCKGLRKTSECDPYAERLFPDGSCSEKVKKTTSGFCEYEDPDTGHLYGLLPFGCHSYKFLTCNHLGRLVEFSRALIPFKTKRLQRQSATAKKYMGPSSRRGIIICAGEKIWINAYVLLRQLVNLKVYLPVEIWSIGEELADQEIRTVLQMTGVKQLTFHSAEMPKKSGYYVKVYALLHTELEEVFLIDADNYPVRNIEYMFNAMKYRRTGTFFWPDFWHVQNPLLFPALDGDSYLWDIFGIEMIETPEQESGQLLVDKRRAELPLEVLRVFLLYTNELNFFAHGDKDLFRFAWMVAGQEFHINPYAGSAGYIDADKRFCGRTMVQFDGNNAILFLHRNLEKFSQKEGRRFVWEYYQQYAGQRYPWVGQHWPSNGDCINLEDATRGINFRTSKELDKIESTLLRFVREGYTAMEQKCSAGCPAMHGTTSHQLKGLEKDLRQHFSPYRVKDHREMLILGSLATSGYELMKKKSVAVGIILQRGDTSVFTLRYIIPRIERLTKHFRLSTILIMEEGICERCAGELAAWSVKNPAVRRLTRSNEAGRSMADLRNDLLAEIKKLADADFCIFYDPPIIANFQINGIAASFGLLNPPQAVYTYPSVEFKLAMAPWDVVCSNLQVEAEGEESYYGDPTTLQWEHSWSLDDSAPAISFNPVGPTVKVEACYGGLAIFKTAVLSNCTFSLAQSMSQEISDFYRCLRENNPFLLVRLNPWQRIIWWQST